MCQQQGKILKDPTGICDKGRDCESDLEKTVDKAGIKHVGFHGQLWKCVQQGLLHYPALTR